MKKLSIAFIAMLALPVATTFADSNASGSGSVLNSESQNVVGTFGHGGAIGSLDNSTASVTFTGGFNANRVRFSGTTTSVISSTWEDESEILVTSPAFISPGPYQWNNGRTGSTFTSFDFDNDFDFPASEAAAGTWNLEFYDTIDDGLGADSETTNLVMTLEEVDPYLDSDGNFTLGTLNIGDTASSVGELAVANVFDTYSFTLASDGFLTATTSFADVYTGEELDSEIALFDSAGTLIATNDDISFPGNTYSELADLSLTAGDYTLVVAGYNSLFSDGPTVTAGASTGDYGLNLSFVSAVPEPTSASIIGLAAVGLAFVRRRRA